MPQFIVLLYDDPTHWKEMPPPELQAAFAKYGAWGKKGRQSGYIVAGNKLMDDSGKVLRARNTVATDGPFIETREVLGGYYLMEAASYEEAVRLCLDHPHLEFGGGIELRQIEVMPASS
jgi:hypothetical protein